MQITPLPREKATFAARKHHAWLIQSLSVEQTPLLPLPLNGRRVGMTPPCAGAKNAACGDGNPRVRRLPFPQAAFGAQATVILHPSFSGTSKILSPPIPYVAMPSQPSFPFLPFSSPSPFASRPVCCDAIATLATIVPISSFLFSSPFAFPSRMLRCHRNFSNHRSHFFLSVLLPPRLPSRMLRCHRNLSNQHIQKSPPRFLSKGFC